MNNQKLISELKSFSDKSAYYYCVLVYVRSHLDPQPVIADGFWKGEIVDDPRGSNGFGYDPHFLLPELNLTVAELESAQKTFFRIAVRHLSPC